MKYLLVSLIAMWNLSVGAAQTQFEDLTGRTLKIVGEIGTLEIRESTDKGIRISISGVDELGGRWLSKVTENGSEVLIRITSSAGQLKKLEASDKLDQVKIMISSQAVPLEISFNRLNLVLNKWAAPIKVSTQEGELNLQNTKGSVTGHIKAGKFNIVSHEGALELISYNGQVNIKKLKGRLVHSNTAGSSVLDGLEGTVKLTTFQGKISILSGSGDCFFDVARGRLGVQNFKGKIEGNVGEGEVDLDLLPEEDLRLHSVTGKVKIQTSPQSGAKVNIESADGELNIARNLSVNRQPNMKIITGKLPGNKNGSIVIKNEQGSLIFR